MGAGSVILWVVEVYAAIGMVCGAAFVLRGVGRVDDAAKGVPIGFRLVIFPGAAALWPWVLVKWARASAFRSDASAGRHS